MSIENSLNAYFKQARTWADDQFGRVSLSRKRYQIAFLAAMGLNIVSMIVIGALANYQTLVPMMVHHYDNGVTTVEPLSQKNAPINRAQIESDIVRYIQHRESYDASSYRAQFNLVHLLSSSQVEREYSAEQNPSNKTSPIKLLGGTGKREVHIYSINFLDTVLENEKDIHRDHHNLAEVVFSLTDTDKVTGKTTQSHYNALVSWHYRKPPESPEERWQNWDGFEVTRYSKSPRSMEKSL
ncbi:type IV secretion system protein [Legionella pneumophila serogroup 8]